MSDPIPQSSSPRFAWRELERAPSPERSAVERVADFLEIHGPFDEETARAQASRCVQCPEPSCVAGCPLSNRIPEWLALTAEGHFLEAAALLHATSSLPEVCARVCPADRMCEGMCILQGKAEPVSIAAIEQFLNEYAFAHGGAEELAVPPNGFRVAVIGSGPGGLTCADRLSKRGYAVTVFDWRLIPGGLLVSGTPAFRLERTVVRRRIEILERRGVKFQLGVSLGEDITYARLRADFDAVFLGFGARKARELSVPGHDLEGVVPALSFLIRHEGGSEAEMLDVAGRQVVVLGAGDMAMDCVRTALRARASVVTCVYRRDAASMSCVGSDYTGAVEEGAQFQFLALPVAVVGNGEGRVKAVRCVRTELAGREGDRAGYRVRPDLEEFEIPADLVLVALGFEPVALAENSPFGNLARDDRGDVVVDERGMTSIRGVFAGGDLVRGPSRILDVVRDARRAADGIHEYLSEKPRH